MNGVILVNKPINVTSRDVVNYAIKKLGIKKIGHTGTLDPIATGVMVLCIGKATKLVDLLTSKDKEYIAEVTLGIKTDTLDITGQVLEKNKCSVSRNQLIRILNSFKGKYMQEVPVYSSVKINGKKLYEYARKNESVELPKREVHIKNIELISIDEDKCKFIFKCLVSKGTYIRSLIRDICYKLNVIGTMSRLLRTKQGNFSIDNCINMNDISECKIVDPREVLDIPIVKVNNTVKNKIINGQLLDNDYNDKMMLFVDEFDQTLAIYKVYDKDSNKIKPYIMLYDKEGMI